MLQRLEATKTCEEPYPHFWLREVFPQEIYRQMLERLPRGSDYVPQKAKRFYK